MLAVVTCIEFLAASAMAGPVRLAQDEWLFASGGWEWQDEVLVAAADEDGVRAFHTAEAYSDVTYSLEFSVPKEGGMPTFGMVFRSEDSERFYFMHYDLLNQQLIAYLADPVPNWVELGRKSSVDISYDEWHKTEIVAKGTVLEAHLDDKLILSVSHALLDSGLVGIRCDRGAARFRNIAVDGQANPLDEEWTNKVREKDWITVCDGGRGEFAAWPDLLWLPGENGGTLLCCLYQGYAHGSPPTDEFPDCGKMVCVRSTDNGRTWSEPITMADTDADDHDGSLVLLKDGRVICNYFDEEFYRGEPGKRVRIEGNRCWRFDICTIESRDGGLTWSEPQVVPTHWEYCAATAGKIVELASGDLLMPVYGWDADQGNAGVGVVRSTDGSATWGPVTLLMTGGGIRDGNEMSIVQLADGRLLALIRPQMLQCFSSDDGKTWWEPAKTGLPGHAPCIIETRAGVLVCGIRAVGEGYGTGVIVSQDAGATWDGPYQIDMVPGAYPGLVELPDGSIYIVYYEEGKGSVIRAKRFRLTPEGIEIIPPDDWD